MKVGACKRQAFRYLALVCWLVGLLIAGGAEAARHWPANIASRLVQVLPVAQGIESRTSIDHSHSSLPDTCIDAFACGPPYKYDDQTGRRRCTFCGYDGSARLLDVTGEGAIGWRPKYGQRSDPASFYTYKTLKPSIKRSGLSGRGEGLEAHHLLEKNFASRFGIDSGDIISVPATPITHRNVGRAYGAGQKIDALILRELTQMGTTRSQASVAQIWIAHKTVYTKIGSPEWAEALYRAYFRQRGVAY